MSRNPDGAQQHRSPPAVFGKHDDKTLELATPIGHDHWELMQLAGRYAYAGREWVARKVVDIIGGKELELVHNHHNEAPHAYRRLPEVLEAQGDTIKVVHTLTPIIVAMAGENEFDPYKD